MRCRQDRPQPALACKTRYPFSSTLIQSTAAMPGSAGEKGTTGTPEASRINLGWGSPVWNCASLLPNKNRFGLLDSGQHRPAPGCLVNRYNRVVVYVTT